MVSIRICAEDVLGIKEAALINQLQILGALQVAKQVLYCLPMRQARIGDEAAKWETVKEISGRVEVAR